MARVIAVLVALLAVAAAVLAIDADRKEALQSVLQSTAAKDQVYRQKWKPSDQDDILDEQGLSPLLPALPSFPLTHLPPIAVADTFGMPFPSKTFSLSKPDTGSAKKEAEKAEETRKKLLDDFNKLPAEFKIEDPDDDCKFELDGDEFDLTPLRLEEGQPEYLAMDNQKMTYKINFCGTTTSTGSDCQRSNGMICQYTPSPGSVLDGVIARWTSKPYGTWSYIDDARKDLGIKLIVSNGDDCSFRGIKKTREALLFFPCNKEVGHLGTITVSETSTCTYVFNIPTDLTCPGAGGSSWGRTFLLVVIFGTLIYLVLGMLWNRYRTGAKGFDALPNKDFWRELPGLVKDGMAFTWRKMVWCKCAVQERLHKGKEKDSASEDVIPDDA